MMMMIIS